MNPQPPGGAVPIRRGNVGPRQPGDLPPNRYHTQTSPTTVATDSPPEFADFPWDNSNSQFGLLGVWVGAEAGIEIPSDYWRAVEGHWLNYETKDGQWFYNDVQRDPSYSMTCAGIASLLVTHDWLGQLQRPGTLAWPSYNRGLERGLVWLMTADNSVTFKDPGTYYVGYNLFTAERVGLASGFKYFGTHDWYREMAGTVLPVQWKSGAFGHWSDGYEAVVQTAFTTLFLSRGRHPVFMEKLWFSGHWANRPRDLANATRFASRELERDLNWQIVPVEHDWTDWLDSPVLFIGSDAAPAFTEADLNKLRAYIQSGGLLFTHADGASTAFNQYVEQTLAPALFPQYAMKDVPDNDPLYSVQYHIKPAILKLRGVSNGSRWLLVHSPTDITTDWQTRTEMTGVQKAHFQFAVNLFVYAAGKSDLRNRIASPYIEPSNDSVAKSISVVRLTYHGNWDPEPYAWTRVDRWMQQHAKTALTITSLPVEDVTFSSAPLAVLTGTAEFTPSDEQIAALKSFVESGGWLFIDDCGGRGEFAKCVESTWLPKLTTEPLASIPNNAVLIKGDGPGPLDDLTDAKYREGTVESLPRSSKPRWVSIGKGKIIYCPFDVTTGLLGANTCGILGYKPASAMSFVKNLILSELQNADHDHLPPRRDP